MIKHNNSSSNNIDDDSTYNNNNYGNDFFFERFAPLGDGDARDAVSKGLHGLQRIKAAGAAVPHAHRLVVAPCNYRLIARSVANLQPNQY